MAPNKHRAYIPALGIMLTQVTLYSNGQMGVDSDHLQKAMPPNHQIDYDSCAIEEIFTDGDGDEDFIHILSIHIGEDWVWLDENDFIPMAYTGLNDTNNIEIYEGDNLSENIIADGETITSLLPVIWCNDMAAFALDLSFKKDGTYLILLGSEYQGLRVVGNVHQNKQVLNSY